MALIAVISVIIVRVWFVTAFAASPLFEPHPGEHDRTLYHEAARAVAQGHIWPEQSFDYLPLYPWVLGACYAVFGERVIVAVVLGLVCDVLTVLCVLALARRMGAHPLAALAAGVLYALYPLAVAYSAITMPNTLNTSLVAALALALHVLDLRRSAWCLGVGLLAGITALGFAGALPVFAAALVWILISNPERMEVRWKGLAWCLIGCALPLAPVALHNSRAEGNFVLLTTHGGFNFYMGNHDRATGYPLRVRDFRMTARAMLEDAHCAAEYEEGRELSRAESSAWWAGQGRLFWKEHPRQALRLTLKKLALFWNFREVDDLRVLEQIRITDGLFASRLWPGFAWFSVLGLIGLLFARKAGVSKVILLTGMFSLVLFFITARYRLTLIPLMAALGAAGVSNLRPISRANILWAVLLIPALFVVVYPFPIRDLRAVDYHNAAIHVLGTGNAERALDLVREGLVIDPNSADLYHAQGIVLARLGRDGEAAQAFMMTVTLNPAHGSGWLNLAITLARSGRINEAIEVLEHWLERMPSDSRARALYNDLRTGSSVE